MTYRVQTRRAPNGVGVEAHGFWIAPDGALVFFELDPTEPPTKRPIKAFASGVWVACELFSGGPAR
jgi:hypothetical protein